MAAPDGSFCGWRLGWEGPVRFSRLLGQPERVARRPSSMKHVANPETELLERCRDGDVDAFEELDRAHAGKLYGLATRMVGSRGEAEDLLQEIFLLAYRRLDTFKGDAKVSTWLYRIAVNRCLDHLRSRGAKMAQAMTALDEGHAAHGSVDASSSAVHRVDLERAIARLPDGYRAAFVLHDVEGLQHREIAVLLGVSEGTSKSQVHKARLRLRTLLTPALPAVAR